MCYSAFLETFDKQFAKFIWNFRISLQTWEFHYEVVNQIANFGMKLRISRAAKFASWEVLVAFKFLGCHYSTSSVYFPLKCHNRMEINCQRLKSKMNRNFSVVKTRKQLIRHISTFDCISLPVLVPQMFLRSALLPRIGSGDSSFSKSTWHISKRFAPKGKLSSFENTISTWSEVRSFSWSLLVNNSLFCRSFEGALSLGLRDS